MDNNFKLNKNDFEVDLTQKKEPVKKRVIKTYRDFAIDALDDKPTSLAKMIIQEKKKKESLERKSVKNPKNIFMIILSSILVLLGIISIASIIIFINKKQEINSDTKIKETLISSIPYDYKKIYTFSYRDIKDANKDLIDNTSIPIGSIKTAFFAKKDENSYEHQVFAKEFMKALDTRAPNQFIRNLKSNFSAGVVSLDDENKPFLILETIDSETSVDNLLAWEKSILYDIGSLFRVNKKYYANKFEDIYIENKDVRAVLDDEGKIVFAYTFVTPHKILFFTDVKTLKVILQSTKNFIKK